MSLKNPVTPPGIDPGTVRLIAQRLNHYATPGPLFIWVPEFFSPGVKPPGREADHSCPSSVGVENERSSQCVPSCHGQGQISGCLEDEEADK